MCLLQARTQGQRHRPGRTPLGQSDAVMRAGQHVASMGLDQRKGALLPRAEGTLYSSALALPAASVFFFNEL